MKDLVELLEMLEKFIYKVLIWVILIPKTVIKITLNPAWATDYIKQELGEGKSRFDEYMSPVVLMLLVALIPAILIGFRPVYGADLTSPALAAPSANRSLEFDATAAFKSSADGNYVFIWTVYKEVPQGNNYADRVVSSIKHSDDSTNSTPAEYTVFNQVDAHSVTDSYTYEFNDKASNDSTYYVDVEAYKLGFDGNTIEYYSSEMTVNVPADFNNNITVSSYSTQNTSDEKKGASESLKNFTDQFKSESTYLLALGLLLPPLLFALAIKLFSRETLSEDLLKETFYVQCYYFSPLTLAVWATYYAIYFTTSDAFLYSDTGYLLVLLPVLLASVWFISVETHAIASERQVSGWEAFLTVFVCIVLILGGGLLVIYSPGSSQLQDEMRKGIIWFYILAAFGLLTAYGIIWLLKLKAEKRKMSTGSIVTIAGFVFVIVAITGVAFLGGSTVPEPLVIETDTALPSTSTSTPQAVIIEPTIEQSTELPTQEAAASVPPTQEAAASASPTQDTTVTLPPTQDATTAPSPTQTEAAGGSLTVDKSFYTEDFTGNLDSWTHFMTNGDESQAKMTLTNGNLNVQLSENGNTQPALYLVNNDFTYQAVQLQAVTTNKGNNANGISLICQYSDKGWYEFQISNSGLYSIFAVDAASTQYDQLASGGSSAIKAGLATNSFTAICNGSELTLYVNDKPVKIVTDTTYNFAEGKIGIGVSSPQGLPVNIDLESLAVSAPQSP